MFPDVLIIIKALGRWYMEGHRWTCDVKNTYTHLSILKIHRHIELKLRVLPPGGTVVNCVGEPLFVSNNRNGGTKIGSDQDVFDFF